jgi:hypothetical protein
VNSGIPIKLDAYRSKVHRREELSCLDLQQTSTSFSPKAHQGEVPRSGKVWLEGVEFFFPYDSPMAEIVELLARRELKNVLFTCPSGDWAAGECAIVSSPEV